jgi:hypothetical protein
MIFNRAWAMPSHETFSIKPISDFVERYVSSSKLISIDPFARNNKFCRFTNDLNPDTEAEFHVDAVEFLKSACGCNMSDLIILDPPYSPRQISECYQGIGKKVTMKDTQISLLHKQVRDEANRILIPGGIVLSFGWNSVGMGKGRGYELVEILLVCHGGGHNDTICLAERKNK